MLKGIFMNLSRIFLLSKYFIKSKWKFIPPPKKYFLIFDGIINPFHKYFNKKNINVLKLKNKKYISLLIRY